MENIIKYVVECNSLYGIIALVIAFLGFDILGYITYKIVQFVLPYIYKITCKHYNIVKEYKEVHTKLGANDISYESDLHQ